MNHSRLPNFPKLTSLPSLLVSAAALLLVGAAGASAFLRPAAAQQQPAPGNAAANGPVTVGVIDVDRIGIESQLRKSLEESVKSYRDQVQAQIEQGKQQITQLSQQLQEINANTDKARSLRQQIILKSAEVKTLGDAGNQELGFSNVEMDLKTVQAINEAAAQVARERNIALVVRKSPPLPSQVLPSQAQLAQEVIARQLIVYASPQVDITTAVLLKMDENFKASGGANAGTAPPAAGK